MNDKVINREVKQAERDKLVEKYKTALKKNQFINELKTGFVACKKSKNPDKCQGSISKRYGKLNKQIIELSRKV